MRLAALVDQVSCIEQLRGAGELQITGVEEDSRRVMPGDLYVAIDGTRQSGLDFVSQALDRGAVAIACERRGAERVPAEVPLIVVSSGRLAAAQLASAMWEHPQRALRSVGVTGTNGKTTTSMLCRQILTAAGFRTGLLGTVAYDLGAEVLSARETTPGGVRLVGYLATMRKAGLSHLVMEVSSHALDQDRTAGIAYDCAVLTNITRDHLDYHGTFERYREAKARLFDGLAPEAVAVLPAGTDCGDIMALRTRGRVLWYGRDRGEVRAEVLDMAPGGTRLRMWFPDGEAVVRLPLPGHYNVDNALAAAAAAWAIDVPVSQIVAALEHARPVPGRLEPVEAGQPFAVLVDYAHTDDALDNVLRALRPLALRRLVVCFGCGGDRDPGKRALMGAVARRHADHVVLTSDNPRSEDPQAILDQIAAAFRPGDAVHVEVDRRAGIEHALALASSPGDIVLLAGKGHEDYQELAGGRRIPFDDRKVAAELLRARYADPGAAR